jgi:hypothetical protein
MTCFRRAWAYHVFISRLVRSDFTRQFDNPDDAAPEKSMSGDQATPSVCSMPGSFAVWDGERLDYLPRNSQSADKL